MSEEGGLPPPPIELPPSIEISPSEFSSFLPPPPDFDSFHSNDLPPPSHLDLSIPPPVINEELKEEFKAEILQEIEQEIEQSLLAIHQEIQELKGTKENKEEKNSNELSQSAKQTLSRNPSGEKPKELTPSSSQEGPGKGMVKSTSNNFAALRATFAAAPPALEQKVLPKVPSNQSSGPRKVSNIAANLEKMGGIPLMGPAGLMGNPRHSVKAEPVDANSQNTINRVPSHTIARLPDTKRDTIAPPAMLNNSSNNNSLRSRSGTETSTSSQQSKNLRSSGGSSSENEDSMDGSLIGLTPSPMSSFLSPITSPRSMIKDLTDSERILTKQATRIGFRKQVTLRRNASNSMNEEQIDKNIGESVGALLRDFRAIIGDEAFSDFILVIKDQRIPVHKVILASRSPFFKRLFSKTGLMEHKLKCESFEEGAALIEYIYTSQLSAIPSTKVESLYLLAGEMELPELQALCTEASIQNLAKEEKTEEQKAEEEAKQKRKERRKFIALETLETERTYVKSLKTIFDLMITPFKQQANEKGAILSGDEISQVFSFWEVIWKCHEALLTVIEQRVAVWDDLPELGDIFLDKIAFIKLYKHYINNFDKSIVAIKELKEKKPKFKDFLAKTEFTPALNAMSLQSFLILPVQRIPRYVLLLTDLLKNTDQTDPDYNKLKDALEMIKELADYINANKHDTDEINRLLAIQDRVSNWPSESEKIVKARRRLVREGVINVNKDKCTVFLFTDALLITKGKGSKLKYKEMIPLQTSSLIISSEKFDFEIMAPGGKIGFHAGEDKNSWVKAIADATERSQKELLNSAFAGHETRDSEGSKQFKENRDEEDRKKRVQVANEILRSEQEYVDLLSTILTSFLEPLRETVPPLISQENMRTIFSTIPTLFKAHTEFLGQLSKRVKEWSNESSLSDLFYAHTAEVLKPYEIYLQDNVEALETLDFLQQTEVSWAIFLVTTEKESGQLLSKLIEAPVRRLSNYYLSLQELAQYTHENNPDYEKLPQVITRISEHLESQKGKKVERKGPPKLERRASTRMGSPLVTQKTAPVGPASRKTSMTVSASTAAKPRKAIGEIKF